MRLVRCALVAAALLCALVVFVSSWSSGSTARWTRDQELPVGARVHSHSSSHKSPLQIRDEVVKAVSQLEARDARRLVSSLACSYAAPGDAALYAACVARTPPLGALRKVASAFRAFAAEDSALTPIAPPAVASPMSAPSPSPSSSPSPMPSLTEPSAQLVHSRPANPTSNASALITRTPIGPAWLNHVRSARSAADDWRELRLQQWELAPLLAPHVPPGALPPCVWSRLAQLCATLFQPRMRKVRQLHPRPTIVAEWEGGLICYALVESPSARIEIGRMKPTSTEVENAIMLSAHCAADSSNGTRLDLPMPMPGDASLPVEALLSGVAASGAARDARGRMALLRAKLRSGRRVRILAIGASNTAMFAPGCADHGCEVNAHESDDAVRERLAAQAAARGALGRQQSDWLVRLLLVLHRKYPAAPLLGVAQAYGGLDPKSVAGCLSDFLEGSRPFVALESTDPLGRCPETRAEPGGCCDRPPHDPPHPGARGCTDAVPDLLVIDFAIFAGKTPDRTYLLSLEKVLRHLWPTDAAVILLNMGNWCRGAAGRVSWDVMGHAKCQRLLFDEEASVRHLGRAPMPDTWHDDLAHLASHYGYAAVSTFHALQPLVVARALRVSDFTQDGMVSTCGPIAAL